MFIQSNCHHHGNQKYPKICKTPESFLNFFYKSKNGFDPEKTPEQCRGYPWSGSEGGSGNRNPEVIHGTRGARGEKGIQQKKQNYSHITG